MTEDEKKIVAENILNESDFYISFLDSILNDEKISKEEKEKILPMKVQLEKSTNELNTLLSNNNSGKSR